jgi:hypothetical protein
VLSSRRITDRDRIGIRFWTEYSHGTALSNRVGVFRRVIAGRRGVLVASRRTTAPCSTVTSLTVASGEAMQKVGIESPSA